MEKLEEYMTELYNAVADYDHDTNLYDFIQGLEDFLNDIE